MALISYAKTLPRRSQETSPRAAGNTYTLNLTNQSETPWMFYVYQRLPNQSANVFSLAWFCSPFMIGPREQVTFQWTIDYVFVWGEVAMIMPGEVFSVAQSVPCEPAGANTTIFSASPEPNLATAAAGPPQGSLVIQDAANVPEDAFSVGIGMGNAGTFATAAGPNLMHKFTPDPTYWIAAGNDVQIGAVLDIATITQNLPVIFPVNVYKASYTLQPDNTWSPS